MIDVEHPLYPRLSAYEFEFVVGGVQLRHTCGVRLLLLQPADEPWTALNVLVAVSQHRCELLRPSELPAAEVPS